MTYCPTELPDSDGSMDSNTVALVRMYQLYGVCAGGKADLIDYLTQPPKRSIKK